MEEIIPPTLSLDRAVAKLRRQLLEVDRAVEDLEEYEFEDDSKLRRQFREIRQCFGEIGHRLLEIRQRLELEIEQRLEDLEEDFDDTPKA